MSQRLPEAHANPGENAVKNAINAKPIQPTVVPPPHTSFLRKASPLVLLASLAVFLSVSLVAVRGKGGAPPPEAPTALTPQLTTGEKLEDAKLEPKEELRAQLNAVRDFLPAAEKLAKAVGTPQAHPLLDLAYAAVPAGEEEAGKKDIKELKGCLIGALTALRRLYQAACTAAEAADTYDYEDGKGLISSLSVCEDESLSEAQRERLVPFKISVHFSYLHYMRLSKEVQAMREKIEDERPYKIEGVKRAFLSAAADLKHLQEAKEGRKRAFKKAVQRRQGLQGTVRLLLTKQAFNALQQLQEEFGLVSAYVALAEEAAISQFEDAGMNGGLAALKENIAKSEMLLATLVSEFTTVLAGEDFGRIKAQVKKIEASLAPSKDELEKAWSIVTSHMEFRASLRGPLKEKTRRLLTQTLERACRKQELQTTLESMRAAILEALAHSSSAQEDSVGDGLAKRLLEEADAIVSRSHTRTAYVNSSKQSVKQVGSLNEAASVMRLAAATGAASLEDLVDARLLMLKAHLLSSLEEETGSLMQGAAVIFQDNQQLEKLRNQLDRAHQAAKAAGTLEEKAHAVAEMRTIADEAWRAGRT
ncbi:hypothetical protein ACSSS7_002648 [Eimeria intestinalis]